MFKKMNNKGYMLIEIILAFALAFAIMYFMMDMVIKLKNKNDDLLVKTLIYSDQAIVSNKIMEHLIDDTDEGTTNRFSCDKISVDRQVVKYNDEVINIIKNAVTDAEAKEKLINRFSFIRLSFISFRLKSRFPRSMFIISIISIS